MTPEGTTGRLSLFRSLGEFCGSATTAQRPKKATELSSRCRRYLTTQAAEAKSACCAGKSTSSAVRTLKNGPYRSSIGRGTQPRVTITAHVRFFVLTICDFRRPPPVLYQRPGIATTQTKALLEEEPQEGDGTSHRGGGL